MEFVQFFTEMHWAVAVLLVISIIFFIIEAVVPGFGIWGIMGIVCGIVTIICEAIFTQSLFAVFLMIFLILLSFSIIFIIFSLLLSKGFLKKTPLVENTSALPEDYKNNESLKHLIGKSGKIVSLCKPVGKAVIDGATFTVRSNSGSIYVDEIVTVVEIKDNTIIVELKGGENA